MSLHLEITTKKMEGETRIGSTSLMYPLLQLASSQGVCTRRLFSDLGCNEAELYADDQMTYSRFKAVLCAIEKQKSVGELGLLLGKNFALQNFGIIAQTAITAPTIRRAIQLFLEYLPIFVQITEIKQTEHDGPLTCVYKSKFYDDPIAQKFFASSGLSVAKSLFEQIANDPLDIDIEFTRAEPEELSPYIDMFGLNPKFDKTENSLVIKNLNVDAPLSTSNPIVHRQGVEYCMREISKLKTMQKDAGIGDRVRELIRQNLSSAPSLAFLANCMGMSERTLRRHLSSHGLNFRQIYESVKSAFAMERLVESNEPISIIAQDLGYDNSANFSRAFKKWAGQSPKQFRAANQENAS